jgi:response regulator NasT
VPGDRVEGLLMGEYGLTEPEAFRWIRHGTIDHRPTMKGVRHDWDPDLF